MSFWHFVLLAQEVVSTSSIKNLQKTKECHFEPLKTFAFDLKVASKLFSKMFSMSDFEFTQFCMYALPCFPQKHFELVH